MKKLFATLAAGLFALPAVAQTYPAPTFGSLILQNPLTPANGGTGATTSTGTGSVVLSNSPSLITPALGTPSSVTLTHGTGLPISTGVSGLGTGVAAGLANAVTGSGAPVLATSPTLASPTITGALTATGLVTTADLATQAANTVLANVTGSTASPAAFAMPSCSGSNNALRWTSGTGFACASSIALTTSGLNQFASTTSAQLASIVSDETGSGGLVFGTNPTITGATISGGTGSFTTLAASGAITGTGFNNLFASPPNIGAVAPATGKFTTLATTGALTQPLTGQFYQNLGANVNRMNDRAFLGEATVQDGTLAGAQDYVSANIPQGPTTAITQFASYSTTGNVGIIGGSRSSDSAGAGTEGNLGVMGIVINDATGVNQQIGEGGYFEGQQKAGGGFTAALEFDSVNQSGSLIQVNPFTMVNGAAYSVGAWIAGGGARSGVSTSTAAIGILDNGAQFDKGIVFQAGAIANHEDIVMPTNDEIAWWGNSSTPTGFIQSTQTTGTEGIVLADNGIDIGNIPGGISAGLFVNNTASAVNYVQVTPETTGVAPVIQAKGSDANVSLVLGGQGTGGAVVQGNGTGAAAPAGYVGQFLSASTTGTSMGASGSVQNLTNVFLGAGVWDVQCVDEFIPTGSTTIGNVLAGVSTASQALGGLGSFVSITANFTTGGTQYITSPVVRLNLASPGATTYCVASSVFGGSTMTGSAFVRATRVN